MSDRKNVYIAAPWVDKHAAAAAADAFEFAGFTITERWWDHRDVTGTDAASHRELAAQAMKDIDGVLAADVFVLLNLSKSEGKAVETGIAIATGIPVILVGEKSNIFHYVDVEQVKTVREAIPAARDAVRLFDAAA